MNKISLLILICGVCFLSGFVFKNAITNQNKKRVMKKATGIGGIFFKCNDPIKMKEWYKTHLGIDAGQYGASFEWYEDVQGKKKGLTHGISTPWLQNSMNLQQKIL
jgi:hypothetical protein